MRRAFWWSPTAWPTSNTFGGVAPGRRFGWALLAFLISSLFACGDDGTGPESTEAGTAGGTVTLAGGAVTLTIPATALPGVVSFTTGTPNSVPSEELLVAGSTYELGPPGTSFSRLTTLTIAYDPAHLPEGVRQSELRLQRVDGDAWSVISGSSVDTVRHVVSGKIDSVGVFGAVALPVASVELLPIRYNLDMGQAKSLYVSIRGPSGESLPNRKVEWTSSNEAVATVDGTGVVTGVGGGSAIITAVVEGRQGTASINVYGCSAQTSVPASQCSALIAVYDAFTNSKWRDEPGWVQGTDPCDWWHVTCTNGIITGLHLSLTEGGTISYRVGDLSDLTSLTIWDVDIVGSLPSSLGSLTKLEVLSITGSSITGTIPPELGQLSNLRELDLRSNQLTGTIPPELGNLSGLITLVLGWNHLSGAIPPELANLSSLTELTLASNELTGSVPTWLAGLTHLENLGLSFNQLTGGIPKELGALPSLSSLGVDRNQLSGSIPAELGNLTNLQGLYLYGNNLTGAVPLVVAQVGGKIQATTATYNDCAFIMSTWPGNTGLTLPDTQEYRAADLDADGKICGLAIGGS